MTRITVVLPRHVDPRVWAQANARGECPGEAPYGLHRLNDYGSDVTYELARPAGRDPRGWRGLASSRVWTRSARGRSEQTFAISWDERLAVPLLSNHCASGEFLASGVIWATDSYLRRDASLRTHAMKGVLRRLDQLWTLSRGQIPVLSEWLGVDADQIAFVPFGVDTAFFPMKPMPERPMLLSLGNDRDRDTETLYAVLDGVHKARPEVDILVQSRSRITPPSGIRVVNQIPASRLVKTYESATAVVISTRPNLHVSGMTAALESMSVGRPVVMTGTPGSEDYVRDGETGILTRPGDVKGMTEAVLNVIDEPVMAARWGSRASSIVRAHHSEASLCEGIRRAVGAPH